MSRIRRMHLFVIPLILFGVLASVPFIPHTLAASLSSVPSSYAVGIGILTGPVSPLPSARVGQDADTHYSTDPTSVATVLTSPHYFQVNGVASGGTYTYPWHFQRTDPRNESTAVVTFGANAKRHTEIIAVGVPTGALLSTPSGGHTTSGGAVPPTVAAPAVNLATIPNFCGTPCNTVHTSMTADIAFFDPAWIKLNEGKTNLSCTENQQSVYNCSGWWWAYWLDDGWQLNSSYYTSPQAVGNEVWNSTYLDFEHPWFCSGQPTYATYDPVQVRIQPNGTALNGSWVQASGACAGLLTWVSYG